MFNYLLLYLLLIIIMIIFAHILDRYSCKKNINNDEGFDTIDSNTKDDIKEQIISSVFKLKVNLPHLKTYIPDFNENVAKKYFYLAFVKLNPNCDIINVNNACVSIYIDEKKCNNQMLSIESNKDTYRLVLIHESQINSPDLIGTSNFTFEEVNNIIYLKSINNGHYPSLYKNDVFIPITGDISNVPEDININNITKNNNIVCGDSNKDTIATSTSKMISGIYNLDGNMYLLSTTDIKNSSPIKIVYNQDGNIQIQFVKYNKYGQEDDYYDLIYNPTNIESTSIYKVNTISFDKHDMRLYPSNTLSFIPEIINYSKEYLKNKYVKNINS
jgi:hypothetical protein